jgi:hypothetical protein
MAAPDKCSFDPHDETIQDLRDFLLRSGAADPTVEDTFVDEASLERLFDEAARHSNFGDLPTK